MQVSATPNLKSFHCISIAQVAITFNNYVIVFY